MPHLRRMVLRQSSCLSQLACTIGFTSGIRGAGRATRGAMTIWDKCTIDRPRARGPRASPTRAGWYGALSSFALSIFALSSLALLALTGCGSDGAGAIFVDPGRYTLYHCDELATRRKALIV